MKYVQIFNAFGTAHGVRCLVSKISIRSRIDQFKDTYFNLSTHIVTYTILHSMASKEVDYVNLSKSMQNPIHAHKQTYWVSSRDTRYGCRIQNNHREYDCLCVVELSSN